MLKNGYAKPDGTPLSGKEIMEKLSQDLKKEELDKYNEQKIAGMSNVDKRPQDEHVHSPPGGYYPTPPRAPDV